MYGVSGNINDDVISELIDRNDRSKNGLLFIIPESSAHSIDDTPFSGSLYHTPYSWLINGSIGDSTVCKRRKMLLLRW